jgi:hypothetical protein
VLCDPFRQAEPTSSWVAHPPLGLLSSSSVSPQGICPVSLLVVLVPVLVPILVPVLVSVPLPVLVPVVEPFMAFVLVRIILVCTLLLDIVLVIHVLRGLLSVTASLDRVVLVHSLGLSQLVDFAANEASEKFLGELVRDGLACAVLGFESTVEGWRRHAFIALVVLKKLHSFEGGSTCDQFMRELGLIVIALVALVVLLVVDLLMSVLSFVCREKS